MTVGEGGCLRHPPFETPPPPRCRTRVGSAAEGQLGNRRGGLRRRAAPRRPLACPAPTPPSRLHPAARGSGSGALPALRERPAGPPAGSPAGPETARDRRPGRAASAGPPADAPPTPPPRGRDRCRRDEAWPGRSDGDLGEGSADPRRSLAAGQSPARLEEASQGMHEERGRSGRLKGAVSSPLAGLRAAPPPSTRPPRGRRREGRGDGQAGLALVLDVGPARGGGRRCTRSRAWPGSDARGNGIADGTLYGTISHPARS